MTYVPSAGGAASPILLGTFRGSELERDGGGYLQKADNVYDWAGNDESCSFYWPGASIGSTHKLRVVLRVAGNNGETMDFTITRVDTDATVGSDQAYTIVSGTTPVEIEEEWTTGLPTTDLLLAWAWKAAGATFTRIFFAQFWAIPV